MNYTTIKLPKAKEFYRPLQKVDREYLVYTLNFFNFYLNYLELQLRTPLNHSHYEFYINMYQVYVNHEGNPDLIMEDEYDKMWSFIFSEENYLESISKMAKTIKVNNQ